MSKDVVVGDQGLVGLERRQGVGVDCEQLIKSPSIMQTVDKSYNKDQQQRHGLFVFFKICNAPR